MAALEMTPKRLPKAAPDWPWVTLGGRVFSWSILLLAFAVVATLKWSGVRGPGVMTWEPRRWILGWAPSFVMALALPFMWSAIGRRVRERATGWISRIDFLPECIFTGCVLLGCELADLFVPELGNSRVQTFAVADVVATFAGTIAAFALYRTLTSIWPARASIRKKMPVD